MSPGWGGDLVLFLLVCNVNILVLSMLLGAGCHIKESVIHSCCCCSEHNEAALGPVPKISCDLGWWGIWDVTFD